MSLKSMTGYGKGEAIQSDIAVTVEIKTVNHRYIDIAIKLPRTFMSLENSFRKQVAAKLRRGKVDVYVNYELTGEAQALPRLNLDLAKAYHQLLSKLSSELELHDQIFLDHLISQKDVIQVEEENIDEELLANCLRKATDNALEQLVAMRVAEGAETRKDIDRRLQEAERILGTIEQRAPQVPVEWHERLSERLERLQQNVEWDPQRVAQEIAVFTDRCDICEEISRFKSHLKQFRDMLDVHEPVGRRMDFLVQELNREVNTMGSKCNDAELTSAVVALKSELEKIREQVQNVE